MATKKKKKKSKKKASRKAAIEKAALGVQDGPFDIRQLEDELKQEMKPLLISISARADSKKEIRKNMFEKFIPTEYISETPEFKHLFFDPIETSLLFIKACRSHGIPVDELEAVDKEALGFLHTEFFQKCIRNLLTPELKNQILAGLNNYRLRIRRLSGDKKVATIAAMLMILGNENEPAFWSSVGLVRGILLKSLDAGMDFCRLSINLAGENLHEENVHPRKIAEKIPKEKIEHAIKTLSEKYPGLTGYFGEMLQDNKEQFQNALFYGELELDVFSDKELRNGITFISNKMGVHDFSALMQNKSESSMEEEKYEKLLKNLKLYLEDLATPQWIDGLLDRLDSKLENLEKPEDQKYAAQLDLIRRNIEKERNLDAEEMFIMVAFLGELRKLTESVIGRET